MVARTKSINIPLSSINHQRSDVCLRCGKQSVLAIELRTMVLEVWCHRFTTENIAGSCVLLGLYQGWSHIYAVFWSCVFLMCLVLLIGIVWFLSLYIDIIMLYIVGWTERIPKPCVAFSFKAPWKSMKIYENPWNIIENPWNMKG